jgi:hypothetical protein
MCGLRKLPAVVMENVAKMANVTRGVVLAVTKVGVVVIAV